MKPLGALMVDISGASLDLADKELIQRDSVGGLILFSRNYESPRQLMDLIGSVRAIRDDVIISVDQEGGRVQRFREGFVKLPSLSRIGEIFEQDPKQGLCFASKCGWVMASELLYYGIDFSFAPVLDLQSLSSRVIGDRAFSREPAAVVELARAYIGGMNQAGMRACGKHFPGHGTVAADSHTELPVDNRCAENILKNDFVVFAELVDCLGGIMPAHVIYPEIDHQPAGYSNVWIQEKLRKDLGFEGVVFSDDLSMEAAKSVGSPRKRAEMALGAGCDMILACNDSVSALEISDWLETESNMKSDRTSRMKATPSAEIKNLFQEDKWIGAVEAINSFHEN